MPGIYKKKNCPVCGVEHRRRGPYCSRSHALSDRKHTEATKQKMSETHTERLADKTSDVYLDTIAALKSATAKSHGIETSPIAPMIQNQYIDDNHFVESGDYWIVSNDF